MEFGELVELSEEEYVLSIASSIEKFREENNNVDDLIMLEYEKLSKLLDTIKLPTDIRLNKIEKFKSKEFDETVINFIYQFRLQLIYKEDKTHDIDWQSIFTDGAKTRTNSYHSLEVEKITTFLEVKYSSYYPTDSLEHYHIRQKISEATLIMNQFLYKNRDKTTEIFHSILELSSRKHDIDALNRSIKEHQKQAFIRSIEESIERDGEITFTLKQAEDINLESLNRNWRHTGLHSIGWYGRYVKTPSLIESESTRQEVEEARNRRFVKKIVFTKKKLSQYNDATFYNFNDEVLETTTNQNLYKEKFMSLLENLNTKE